MPNNTNNTNNTERETIIIEKRTITRVTAANDARNPSEDGKRLFIQLSGDTFKGFDANNVEIMTNSFSKNIQTLCQEIGVKSQYLNLAYALFNGHNAPFAAKRISLTFLSLVMQGSDITIKRTLKKAGDNRNTNNVEDVFENDTWVTEIVDFAEHIQPLVEQLLMNMVANDKIIEVKEYKANTPSLSDILNKLN